MANLNLSNGSLYELVNEKKVDDRQVDEVENTNPTVQAMLNVPVNKVTQQDSPVVTVKVNQKSNKLFKRSLGGFLLFVAIVVVLALCIYFTLYRLGWGVSECMKKNYHNCGVLLTPEVAPLALTGLATLI